MPRALLGRMPRCLRDHRSREAKRLREVYLDLITEHSVVGGTARRLALLVAQAWLTYERLTNEIHVLEGHKVGRNTVTALRRLRRQQGMASKTFRFGVQDLKAAKADAPPNDLALQIAATQGVRRLPPREAS